MDLDALRTDWAARDRALQQSLQQHASIMRDLLVQSRLASIRTPRLFTALELAIYIAFVAGFGAFIAGNWGQWEFVVPALLLDAWTIAMGAATLIERTRLRDVDFGAPVLQIQQRLATLRRERARVFQWAFLTGQVLWWTPFLVVVMRGLFGVNLYTVSDFMPRFIAINLAVGVAVIPVLLWVARVVGPRLAQSRAGRSFVDGIVGRDLAEAEALARSLERFEKGG